MENITEILDTFSQDVNFTTPRATPRPAQPRSLTFDQLLIYYVAVVVQPTLCFFGIIGNAISLAVFRHQRRLSSAQFLLQALAVYDFLFLISAIIIDFPRWLMSYGHFGNTLAVRNIFVHWSRFFPAIHVCELGAVLMIAIITFDRFIHICLPMKAQKMNTRRNAKIAVAVMSVFIVLSILPSMLERYIIWKPHRRTGDLWAYTRTRPFAKTQAYLLWYKIVFITFVFDVLPVFFIIIPFNLAVLRALRQMTKERDTMGSFQGKEKGKKKGPDSSTILIVSMVIIFILFRLPGCFTNIFSMVRSLDKSFSLGIPLGRMAVFTNQLMFLNSGINFVIYVSVGRSFRGTFRKMCLRCCRGGPYALTEKGTSLDGATELTSATVNGSTTTNGVQKF